MSIRHVLPAVLLILSSAVASIAAENPANGTCGFERSDLVRGAQWGGSDASTRELDDVVQHSGEQSVRLKRAVDSPGSFSTVTLTLPRDRDGSVIELRGWLKSEDVTEWFGLWLRLDGTNGTVGFDNMQKQELRGTTDWTEYRVRMALSPETRKVVFGALVAGPGTLWVDDLSVWIDDKPWSEAPVVVREPTILDTDQRFAGGSGFTLADPTPEQADQLALLGRVWGFLKYHHPAVTGGSRQWDYALFEILPDVVAADSMAEVQGLLVKWVAGLGEIPPCAPCAAAPAPDDVAQPADLAWLGDTALLGRELSDLLLAVHAARPADGAHFWVDFNSFVGNPDFSIEPSYGDLGGIPADDRGYHLLGLFRYWNIIQYWCPNRDIIGEDWPSVLRRFVPRVLAPADPEAYERELLALVATLNDTHTQLYGSLSLRPPGMDAQVPYSVRWVEDRPVVWKAIPRKDGEPVTGLEPGDIIAAVDGRPWADLFAAWAPYYSASNDFQRNDDLANALLQGPVGATRLTIERGGERLEVPLERVAMGEIERWKDRWHTLAGPVFQVLDGNVAYLKLEGIKRDSVGGWIDEALAADVAGLVLDCRAYPGDFPIFALGGRLVAETTPFATFTRADPVNPGAFLWHDGQPLEPIAPHFDRPVVILVDEMSQSSAEYHALAWRAAPQALVMGGTSSGADGNVSHFVFPGNFRSMISGIGVYDAARNNTQRAGIVPDIRVEPTLAGIRDGRDEVLAAAVANILARSGM